MGVGVAADVDEQRGVVDDRALLLVEPDALGQPQRDQALPQHVLHRLPEAEVDAERERGHQLRQPNLRAIGLADRSLSHEVENDRARGTRGATRRWTRPRRIRRRSPRDVERGSARGDEKGGRRRGPLFAQAPQEQSRYLSTSASAAPSRSVEVTSSCEHPRGGALTLPGVDRSPDSGLTGALDPDGTRARPMIVGGAAKNRFNGGSHGRLAQLVEHLVYTEGVGGSSPSPPTHDRLVERMWLNRAVQVQK